MPKLPRPQDSMRRTHVNSPSDGLQRPEGASRPVLTTSQAAQDIAETLDGSGLDPAYSVTRPNRRTYDQAFAEGNVGDPPRSLECKNLTAKRARANDAQVDGLATVSTGNDDAASYGESSTIAFARQVAPNDRSRGQTHRAIARSSDTGPSPYLPSLGNSPHDSSSLTPLPLAEINAGDSVIPLRRNADNYLQCFWDFIHPLFPILHRPSFNSSYERLWDPQSSAEEADGSVTFVPMLNLAFALGCQFSDLVPAEKKPEAAAAFYGRSRSVLLYDVLGSTQVSVIQWLLLSAIYLQSTSLATNCWTSAGLAIRLAQNIGLHLEPVGNATESQIDREMRRRVWHTCVVLDRLLAMTFGRPLMVDKSFTTAVPSLIDDEYLRTDGEGTQPSNAPTAMGLFCFSCDLFAILADVLIAFYSSNSSANFEGGSDLQDMQTKVLALNARLDQFFEALPQHLKSSGWHSVYFTFASATILLASTRLRIDEQDDKSDFELSWNRCSAILKHYEQQTKSARRAAEALRTLRQQTMSQVHATDQASSNDRQEMHASLSTMPIDNELNVPQAVPDGTNSFDACEAQGTDFNFDTWFNQLADFNNLFDEI
ncbi:hypothetical protein KC318_g15434 [Hortaea werneckii]|nr:hypothetical protein KC334_g15564 [Hortaea werneckii]KAI7651792.1 hypothetical protein KC318_g15434 [Hortaea werneckii]